MSQVRWEDRPSVLTVSLVFAAILIILLAKGCGEPALGVQYGNNSVSVQDSKVGETPRK